MKKVLFAYLMLCIVFPIQIKAEKKPLGNGVYWELSSDGTLTISGNGDMPNFSFGWSPWNSEDVKNLIIEDGITTIGDCAFCKSGVITAIIPQSVEHIGKNAFNQCPSLSNIVIPNSVKSIGQRAFLGCKKLTSVKLSNAIKCLDVDVFAHCFNLSSIIIPNSVESICDDAFLKCNIKSIVIPNSVKHIGRSAFKSNNPTSLFVSNSVNFIGEDAFTQDKILHQFSYNNDKLYDGRILLLPDSLLQLHPEEWKKCGLSESSVYAYKNKTHLHNGTVLFLDEKDRNNSSAFDKNSHYLYIIEEKDEKGLVDANGNWIVPVNRGYTKFHSVGGDLLKAESNNHCCLIALNGQEIIPISRGYASIESVENGNTKYYVVSKDGRYGLTDYNGNVIVPTEMNAIDAAGTGFLKFKVGSFWGIMNYKAKVIIPTSRGYTWIGNYVSTTKRFPFEMDGYKGECNNLGQQVSKIKVAKPKPSTTVASSSIPQYTDCMTFDLKGNVKKCISENGTREFDSNGKLIAGRNEKIIYDNRGRIAEIKLGVDGFGGGYKYEYDSSGRVLIERKGLNVMGASMEIQTHNYYNAKGQLVKSILKSREDSETVVLYSDYTYDSKGNWISRKEDGILKVRTIEYY